LLVALKETAVDEHSPPGRMGRQLALRLSLEWSSDEP
jgi:hypothetical protein